MNPKPLVRRALARRDLEDIVDYYVRVANDEVARRFLDRLDQAFRAIRLHPEAGFQKYGYDLKLPGLRGWPVKRYPYIVFYVDLPGYVEVWRVLHAQRDIASWLRDPDDSADKS